ncbi:MAG: hypothetical protein HGA33_00835 [Candidatus Moranbacteria bacterium]|nr:hypothetical protein [Candidatus Moranbacteria bacterium]
MKNHSEKCASWGRTIEACDCDGYHTFGELYDHRITLWIALCEMRANVMDANESPYFEDVWRSKRHSDGEICFGTGTQFVLGIEKMPGEQITYHIPIERWGECEFAETLEKAPEWDGHTSDDVLERLKRL